MARTVGTGIQDFGNTIENNYFYIDKTGYLNVLGYEKYESEEVTVVPKYEQVLTNYEVKIMFHNMVRGWFARNMSDYNDFVKVMLAGELEAINEYINRVACETLSYFDTGKRASGKAEKQYTA